MATPRVIRQRLAAFLYAVQTRLTMRDFEALLKEAGKKKMPLDEHTKKFIEAKTLWLTEE